MNKICLNHVKGVKNKGSLLLKLFFKYGKLTLTPQIVTQNLMWPNFNGCKATLTVNPTLFTKSYIAFGSKIFSFEQKSNFEFVKSL